MTFITTYPMRNSTILRITSEIETIDISPEYQRHGDIWNPDKRKLLIDSIINDYDIPKLYFYVLPDKTKSSKTRKYEYAIIDGRQRIETILSFSRGEFALADDFKYLIEPSYKLAGLTFPDIVKKYNKVAIRFDSYILPIVCIETDDMDLIEDMFSRLNEAVPLNSAEKRNALGGPMVKEITRVSKHLFFSNKVGFTNKRYQHREVSARLLFIEDSFREHRRIYDTKKPYLDQMVKKYKNQKGLDPVVIGEIVENILDIMLNIFTDKDSLLRSQSIIPIYYLIIKYASEQQQLGNITRSKLVEFKTDVEKNRKIAEEDISRADYELLDFDRMSVQGTNDAISINERVRILGKYLGVEIPQFHKVLDKASDEQ